MRNILDKSLDFMKNHRNAIINTLIFVVTMLMLVFLFALIINLDMISLMNDNVYSVDEMIKISDDFDCILILGAGVKKDGSPTDMLYDRLMAGYEAFAQGKSSIILVSGDSEHEHYTETVTMKKALNEKGVDYIHIISDGYGLSTYESIWRAKNVYGFDKILIVSQEYHLYRALYIADEMGLEAYGLDGALRTYRKQASYSFRECFARVKDVIQTEINPIPTYTEKWEE